MRGWKSSECYLLSWFPVTCPNVCKKCLSSQLLVRRLLLVSLFKHSDHVAILSNKFSESRCHLKSMNIRRPKPRRTCIMAVKTASFVGFNSRISSHKTSDSSTFWDLMRARAFKACRFGLRKSKHKFDNVPWSAHFWDVSSTIYCMKQLQTYLTQCQEHLWLFLISLNFSSSLHTDRK